MLRVKYHIYSSGVFVRCKYTYKMKSVTWSDGDEVELFSNILFHVQDNEPVEGHEILVSKYSEDIIIPTQVSFFSYKFLSSPI